MRSFGPARLSYLKSDVNRSFSEPGWPEVPPSSQRKLWVEYVRNLYDIMDRCEKNIPDLKLHRAQTGAGASIWAFCSASTKSGLRTIRKHLTVCASRRVSPKPTPRGDFDGTVVVLES